LVDKDKPLAQIALEEIEEETGYEVPLKDLYKITSFYTAVGVAGGQQTLFYAAIKEAQHAHKGGGIDTEEIEVIYVPRDEVKQFMYDESTVKTSGLMFALMWFFEAKKPNLKTVL
jgi:UDP-sugar diphosphatase